MKATSADAVSRRAREITPFLVMDILERAQELERAGEHGHPPGDRGAGLRHAPGGQGRGLPGHGRGGDPVHPLPGAHGVAAGPVPALLGQVPGVGCAGAIHRHLGHLPGHDPHLRGPPGPRGRGAAPQPALRLLPQRPQAGGRGAPLRAGPGGRRLPDEPGGIGPLSHAPHQGGAGQFSREPHRAP